MPPFKNASNAFFFFFFFYLEVNFELVIKTNWESPKNIIKKMDDTGIEPGTSHMLSECDNQLHQTPFITSL